MKETPESTLAPLATEPHAGPTPRKKVFFIWLIGVMLIFILLDTFAIRKFLFHPGTIGHNWDSPIPAHLENLRYVNQTSLNTWYNLFFGVPKGMMLVTGPLSYFYSLPAYLGLGGAFASKSIYFLTLFFAGLNMFLFLQTLLSRIVDESQENKGNFIYLAAFLGGYLYSLSPFLFNDLIGGAITMVFSYAFFPLIFLFAQKLVLEERLRARYVFGFALSLTLVNPSSHNILLAIILAFLFGWILMNLRTALVRISAAIALFALLNSFFLLPLLSEMGSTLKTLPNSENTGDILEGLRHAPSVWKVMTLGGYWTRHFYLKAIPDIWLPLWYVCTFGTIGFVLYQVILIGKVNPLFRKIKNFWLVVFLISVPLAAGMTRGTGWFGKLVFTQVPFMILFRSFQRLMILPAFSLAILTGIGVALYLVKLGENHKNKWVLPSYLVLFILITVWVGAFFSGNLGEDRLIKNGPGNFIGQYRLAPDYSKALDILYADHESFRILYLPITISPLYLKTEFQPAAQGGDPTIIFNRHSPVFAQKQINGFTFTMVERIKELLYVQNNVDQALRLLRQLNAKYIILRRDIHPMDSWASQWDSQKAYYFLKNHPSLKIRVDGPWTTLFEIKGPRMTHVFPFTGSFTVCKDSDSILTLMEEKVVPPATGPQKDFSICVDPVPGWENESGYEKSRTLANPEPAQPEVSFHRVQDTLFTVEIRKVPDRFILLFQEGFHSGWKIYPTAYSEPDGKGGFSPFSGSSLILKKYLDEKNHVLSNGYANAWILDAKKLKKDFPESIEKAPDGSYTLRIAIGYRSQQFLAIGLMIGFLTFIVCTVVCFLERSRFSKSTPEETICSRPQ